MVDVLPFKHLSRLHFVSHGSMLRSLGCKYSHTTDGRMEEKWDKWKNKKRQEKRPDRGKKELVKQTE